MDINFESYFSEFLNNEQASKFVVVLGSGFHSNNSCKSSLLSNWTELLQSVFPNFESSGNYLLDFERLLLNETSHLAASQKENTYLKEIASKIKEAQTAVLNNQIDSYPSFIFNTDYVSDVISLNFDTVAEKLCRVLFKAKLKSRGYIIIDQSLSPKAMVHQTTRYRTLEFPNGKTIRFWYPHGSIVKPTKMILGARRYGQQIACVEQLRKHSKAKKSKNPNNDTWYDKLTHNPVLILGASISSNEWDVWSAIVNRERNFFKQKNITYRNPIFQMRNKTSKGQTCDTANQYWFQPLFDESLSFKKQWLKLEELFMN